MSYWQWSSSTTTTTEPTPCIQTIHQHRTTHAAATFGTCQYLIVADWDVLYSSVSDPCEMLRRHEILLTLCMTVDDSTVQMQTHSINWKSGKSYRCAVPCQQQHISLAICNHVLFHNHMTLTFDFVWPHILSTDSVVVDYICTNFGCFPLRV